MPGQWEFQIGYPGIDGETGNALTVSDHVWIARWLLHRLGERSGVEVSFDNKPVKGDWNGAGMHTNFSTAQMREPSSGRERIEAAIGRLSGCSQSRALIRAQPGAGLPVTGAPAYARQGFRPERSEP